MNQHEKEAVDIHNTAQEIISSGGAKEFLQSVGLVEGDNTEYTPTDTVCDCEKNYGSLANIHRNITTEAVIDNKD